MFIAATGDSSRHLRGLVAAGELSEKAPAQTKAGREAHGPSVFRHPFGREGKDRKY